MRIAVEHIVDPHGAVVLRAKDGSARFDLRGVPRVDHLLVGKPAREVPNLVARLCGLCPVTHHLAGMGALDQLVERPVPHTARLIRLLMHYGAVVEALGPRLSTHVADARELLRSAKAVLRLAGVPGHFPDQAIPGGVRAGVEKELLKETVAAVGRAQELVAAIDPGEEPPLSFDGVDVVLRNDAGEIDPLGRVLPGPWKETRPGDIAPRPVMLVVGRWQAYRVGPTAHHPQLGARAAQVATVAESLDAIAEILGDPELLAPVDCPDELPIADGEGVGMVDGPRGLLIHRYVVEGGLVAECQILSPTAQNEPWLAQMLSRSESLGAMEAAIRAADPCLPCTSAPPGGMALTIQEEDAPCV